MAKRNAPLMKVDPKFKDMAQQKKMETGLSMRKITELLIGDLKKVNSKKKGQLSDIAVFMTTLFGIALLVTLTWFVSDGLVSALDAGGFNDTATADNVIEGISDVGKSGDTIMGILLGGFMLALIVSAILIPTDMIFMVIYLIGVSILWLVSPILANAWEATTSTGTLATAVSNLPLTNTIMLNFPTVMTIVVFMILLILYGKGRLNT